MFWLLDCVVHLMFVICCQLSQNEWFKFQVDLRLALLNYAISEEWRDLNGPHPRWIRQDSCIACNCEKCYFCLNGLTNGTGHIKKHKASTVMIHPNNSRTVTKGCTGSHVNSQRGVQYCKSCVRKLCNGTEKGKESKRQREEEEM